MFKILFNMIINGEVIAESRNMIVNRICILQDTRCLSTVFVQKYKCLGKLLGS